MDFLNSSSLPAVLRVSNKKEATNLACYVVTAYVALQWLGRKSRGNLKKKLTAVLLKLGRTWVPAIRNQVNSEIMENTEKMRMEYARAPDEKIIRSIPEQGQPAAEVIKLCEQLMWKDYKIKESKPCSGAVYHALDDLTNMQVKVLEQYHWHNALHPDMYPSMKKMEAEIVSMVLDMYNGPSGSCGTVTSGGTESILLAIKTYRDWAKSRKRITDPNIVVPFSAHAAFDKACGYFGIEIRHAPLLPDGKVNLAKMKRLINRNTICIVGSGPSYAWGVCDQIEELSALAQRKRIGLHVDCCLGSFVMPFLSAAGFEQPVIDFRLPGVTSISCDTHKYGFSPKGTSVVMYRDMELRSFQFFVQPNWPGGLYASPGISGSRPGNVIAGTWATMMHMGKKGYTDAVREIVTVRKRIQTACATMPGIQIKGDSKGSVVAFGSDTYDIFALSSELHNRGWIVNNLMWPSSFHVCVTYRFTIEDYADKFIADMKELTTQLAANPTGSRAEGTAALYGTVQTIPATLIDELARVFWDVYYDAEPEAEGKTFMPYLQ